MLGSRRRCLREAHLTRQTGHSLLPMRRDCSMHGSQKRWRQPSRATAVSMSPMQTAHLNELYSVPALIRTTVPSGGRAMACLGLGRCSCPLSSDSKDPLLSSLPSSSDSEISSSLPSSFPSSDDEEGGGTLARLIFLRVQPPRLPLPLPLGISRKMASSFFFSFLFRSCFRKRWRHSIDKKPIKSKTYTQYVP